MPEQPPSWRPLAVAALAFFVVMAGATIPTPLYPIYAARYGFDGLDITIIFATYSVGVLAALIGLGPWSDEIGRKPMLLAGLGAAAAALAVFMLADGLWLLLLARVLQGLSAGIYTSTATVAVNELAPDGRKRLGGIVATTSNMGGLGSGPVIGALLIMVLPAPLFSPYLVHLVATLAVTALLWRLPEPSEPSSAPHLHAQSIRLPDAVRPVFLPAAIASFGAFMICGFLGAVSPSYLGEVLGHEGAHLLIGVTAGLIFGTSCLAQAVEDRLPGRIKLPLGMGILTLGIAAITAAFWARSLGGLIGAIAFTGIGHGIAFKGGLGAVSARSPARATAGVTALYFTVAYVAISVPVLVIGLLEGPVGLAPVTVGYGAFSTILVATAFVLILRRPQG